MDPFRLQYPVHTLNNLQLLPAGAVLAQKTLNELKESGQGTVPQTFILLNYGSVKDDIIHFFIQLPYSAIFSEKRQVQQLLNLMEGVRLILPVLQSLDYFKKYDFYTYRHILMVFALSTLLAQELVGNYRDLIQEAMAGPTHDFGKTCTPLKVLKKTGPLTVTERRMLEHHTLAGYVLLTYYLQDPNNLSARVARDHHERRDGSGYPKGIRLSDHLVEIVAACDIYDALISPRPYRPTSYDNRTALEEITGMAERGELGWDVVQVLVAHNRKDRPHYSECRVSSEKRGTPPADNVYGVIAKEGTNPSNDQNTS